MNATVTKADGTTVTYTRLLKILLPGDPDTLMIESVAAEDGDITKTYGSSEWSSVTITPN